MILATGGLSYPGTGSTGDGYRWAAMMGHRIVSPHAALVPLEGSAPWAADLQGVSLRDVRAELSAGQVQLASGLGDLLFTHYGLSGPLALKLSRDAVPCLSAEEPLSLRLDLLPGREAEELEAVLLRLIDCGGKRRAGSVFDDLLPARLGRNLVSHAGIPPDKPRNQIARAERERLCHLPKNLDFALTGARPITEAQVTAGGVAVEEVCPRTMASRMVDALYFVGEVLDVDGYSGGFNLQIAFSTGWVAGRAAAEVDR